MERGGKKVGGLANGTGWKEGWRDSSRDAERVGVLEDMRINGWIQVGSWNEGLTSGLVGMREGRWADGMSDGREARRIGGSASVGPASRMVDRHVRTSGRTVELVGWLVDWSANLCTGALTRDGMTNQQDAYTCLNRQFSLAYGRVGLWADNPVQAEIG